MTKKEKRGKRIRKKLLHKYRLVILNEETFEERFTFKLNRLNVFVFGILLSMFLIASTTLIIAFTPLREYIPGYSSSSLKKRVSQMVYTTDSLYQVIDYNERYLASVRKVLTGEIKDVDINKDSLIESAKSDPIIIERTSRMDSLLRDHVEKEDKYNPLMPSTNEGFSFFAPVRGTISDPYNSKTGHYAVDVVTTKDAPVKAIADGTVIFAEWSAQTGNVIMLKHADNMISVYKHNAKLTKSQGQLVKGGEVIAIVGNTGELSTGPHLHFELWRDEFPIDPTSLIDFD